MKEAAIARSAERVGELYRLVADLWQFLCRVNSCYDCGDNSSACCESHAGEHAGLQSRVEAALATTVAMQG